MTKEQLEKLQRARIRDGRLTLIANQEDDDDWQVSNDLARLGLVEQGPPGPIPNSWVLYVTPAGRAALEAEKERGTT